jgi:hypothetical protein
MVDHLGRLKQLSLREAWKDEAREFTPWLAQEDNLKLLGEALSLELELQSQEQEVGPFRADILCRSGDGKWVLVENQLERTDHTHLGQIITYASGLDAVTVVWIAARFTEEHRSAIDWLNQITDDDHNFFALEIELWKIGDSPMAPKFNIVSKPNEWSRTMQNAASGDLRDLQKLQYDYWTALREQLAGNSSLKLGKARPQNSMGCSLGHSGARIEFLVSTWDPSTDSYTEPYIRAEIHLDGRGAKDTFAKLARSKEEIEKEIGERLVWYNPEGARLCRIWLMRHGDYMDRQKWPEQFEWLREKGELLHRVFTKWLKSISDD